MSAGRFLALLAILLGAARAAEPVDVYLLGGQSNATGQGYVRNLPSGFQANAAVLLYHSGAPHLHGAGAANTWHPLQPASETPDRFGPELSLGNELQRLHPGRRIALIKHAHSGTNLFLEWAPGAGPADQAHWGPQFRTFVDTVEAGLAALRAAGYAPQLRGMAWHQGESDAVSLPTARDYGRNLAHFIRRIREQCQTPGLPFVYGLIVKPPASPERDFVREGQRKVAHDSGDALAMPHAWLIPTDDLSRRAAEPQSPYPNDQQHLGTAGMLELGRRMAEALQRDAAQR